VGLEGDLESLKKVDTAIEYISHCGQHIGPYPGIYCYEAFRVCLYLLFKDTTSHIIKKTRTSYIAMK
jgi:hypothetical protein